jgi:hypothetical protein
VRRRQGAGRRASFGAYRHGSIKVLRVKPSLNPPYTNNQIDSELLLLKSKKFKLNSVFDTQVYRRWTKYHPNRQIVLSIASAFDVGFSTGSRGLTDKKIMHKNHASATLYKEDIDKLRSKELKSGRIIPISQELIDQLTYYHNS